MNHTLLRTTAASLALTFLPCTGFAYTLEQLGVMIEPTEETDEASQEQMWDTQCRKQLGLEGGDLLGALKFNLNRCINTQRRQAALQERIATQRNRLQQGADRSARAGTALQNRVANYQMKLYQNTLRRRIEFQSSLPQSQRAEARSFQYVRSRRRLAVQEKEHEIRTTENRRSQYILKARMSCQDYTSHQKATCINEKLEELMGENAED